MRKGSIIRLCQLLEMQRLLLKELTALSMLFEMHKQSKGAIARAMPNCKACETNPRIVA
jgi:hypothetical protein